MKNNRLAILGAIVFALLASAVAQQVSKHMLSSDELKKAVPEEYFFRGQKAPVQLRNAVGFQLADGRMMLAALVDASGYSTAIQQKYQGMLITESNLNIAGSELKPGEYGFGFSADGKFMGDVNAVNVWLSLSRCGDVAPGLDIVPRRFEQHVTTQTDEAFLDNMVSQRMAEEAVEQRPVERGRGRDLGLGAEPRLHLEEQAEDVLEERVEVRDQLAARLDHTGDGAEVRMLGAQAGDSRTALRIERDGPDFRLDLRLQPIG